MLLRGRFGCCVTGYRLGFVSTIMMYGGTGSGLWCDSAAVLHGTGVVGGTLGLHFGSVQYLLVARECNSPPFSYREKVK